jgi:hypothetical protein
MKSLRAFIYEQEVHHVSVVPLVGFSPLSHMGHAHDLGGTLSNLPGSKHVGISAKSDVFTPEERKNVLNRQWGSNVKAEVSNSGGATIANAFNSMPKTGKKVLHIVVGSDRLGFAEGLKNSLEAGKIKEMGDNNFDEIHIHTPKDEDRSHGMSGTNMRQAATNGDIETFHKHLGTMFSRQEAQDMMKKTKEAIDSGKLKVKRK